MAAGYSATTQAEPHLSGGAMTTTLSTTTFGLPQPKKIESKDVTVRDVVERIRATLARRGATALVDLGKSFRLLDRSGRGLVSLEDFARGCSLFGLTLSEQVIGGGP